MAPKKASLKKASLQPIVEAEPEPPPPPPLPRDPSPPLTFEELWYDADNEIEVTASGIASAIDAEYDRDEEKKKVAQDLKTHLMSKAVEIRTYLEDTNMAILTMQALQHLLIDRPLDPFRYLARFYREEGPKIGAELERCRLLDLRKKAKLASDEQARLDAERAAREAAEKANRDKENARLALAAQATAQVAKEAKALANIKAAAESATAAFKESLKVENTKKKEPEKPAAEESKSPKGDKKKEPEKPGRPKNPAWKK